MYVGMYVSMYVCMYVSFPFWHIAAAIADSLVLSKLIEGPT